MALRTMRQRTEDSTFDLDLAPMLSMMVALIPILLLSVIFVRVTIVETPIPQVVADAVEKDKNDKKQLSLTLDINEKKGFEVTLIDDGRKSTKSLPLVNGQLDFDGLHKFLYDLKTKHPEHYSINVSPADGVSYSQIVEALDSARQAKVSEDPFVTKDKENKEVKHKVMFPNVTFANVVEG